MNTKKAEAGQARIEILKKVAEYCNTQEEEYRSHASAPAAIAIRLYEYVFEYRRHYYAGRIRKACNADRLPNLDDFNVEFMETAQNVLQTFSPEKGDFFAYFDTSFISRVRHEWGKQQWGDLHGGMNIPYGRKFRTIAQLLREHSGYAEPSEVIRIAEEEYGVSITEEDVNVYKSGVVSVNCVMENEDGETELLDLIADTGAADPVEEALRRENYAAVLSYIENAFLRTQERQRRYLGAILTTRCSEWIFSERWLQDQVRGMSWFVRDVYLAFEKTRKAMEQKEIAEMLGVSEPVISRAYRNFLDRYLDIADVAELFAITEPDSESGH